MNISDRNYIVQQYHLAVGKDDPRPTHHGVCIAVTRWRSSKFAWFMGLVRDSGLVVSRPMFGKPDLKNGMLLLPMIAMGCTEDEYIIHGVAILGQHYTGGATTLLDLTFLTYYKLQRDLGLSLIESITPHFVQALRNYDSRPEITLSKYVQRHSW